MNFSELIKARAVLPDLSGRHTFRLFRQRTEVGAVLS